MGVTAEGLIRFLLNTEPTAEPQNINVYIQNFASTLACMNLRGTRKFTGFLKHIYKRVVLKKNKIK